MGAHYDGGASGEYWSRVVFEYKASLPVMVIVIDRGNDVATISAWAIIIPNPAWPNYLYRHSNTVKVHVTAVAIEHDRLI